LVKVWES
jgi:hypothetical protein